MSSTARAVNALGILALPFLARWVHQEYRAPAGSSEGYTQYALLGVMCVVVVAMLDAPPHTSSLSRTSVRALATSLLVLGAAATSQVFFPDTLPRFVILLVTLLVFAWLLVVGAVLVVTIRRTGEPTRVVAVVNARDADRLRLDVEEGPLEQEFELAGVIVDEAEYERLIELCTEVRATTLVLGPRASVHPIAIEQAEELHRTGLRVRSLDDFYDEWLGKLPLSALDRFALMGDIESLHGTYAPLKRSIDIVFATLGLLLLLALAPFVLIGNLLGNRGPLFFRQERVGLNDRPFRIWKLRTMTPGAVDVSGWTSNEDPRITPFGKVLRRTHVDELPQVLNIFVGDLAIVGPRPEQVHYARQLEERLPFYAARHLVRPGLTGWAQVKYRYAASEEDAFVKLQFDLHYVRHESLATDIRVIWMTLHHVLTGGGR